MYAHFHTWNFHINEERNGFSWLRYSNEEQDKVAKKYREGLTNEKIEWGVPLSEVSPIGYKLWTTPLDEDLQFITYWDARDKTLEVA